MVCKKDKNIVHDTQKNKSAKSHLVDTPPKNIAPNMEKTTNLYSIIKTIYNWFLKDADIPPQLIGRKKYSLEEQKYISDKISAVFTRPKIIA